MEVLEFIAKQQGFDLSKRLAERIADNSKNNLRQAIRSLEASWKKRLGIKLNSQIIFRFYSDELI